MTKRRSRTAALLLLLIGASLIQSPAGAHDEPLIQPGAAYWTGRSALGQFGPCTLNFVFRDATDIYIGAGAKCIQVMGKRVTMANREFGTVVFLVYSVIGGAATDPPGALSEADDFALIKVDRSEWHRVSPVVLDAGTAPERITTSDETSTGDPVFMTGQGVGFGQWPTRHRIGPLLDDNAKTFSMAVPTSWGDGGAPVLYTDYGALGVLTGHTGTHGAYGTTIERILTLLHQAGFRVRLVDGVRETAAVPALGGREPGEIHSALQLEPERAAATRRARPRSSKALKAVLGSLSPTRPARSALGETEHAPYSGIDTGGRRAHWPL